MNGYAFFNGHEIKDLLTFLHHRGGEGVGSMENGF